MIQVDVGRFCGHARALFTRAWEHIPATFAYPQPQEEPPRPAALNEMLSVAEAVRKGIAFVRVDIYDSNRGPLIGEMTCFPQAGRAKILTLLL
jgi:TupA-like ATPgrasp